VIFINGLGVFKIFDVILTVIIIVVAVVIAVLLFNTFNAKISDSNYRIMATTSDVFAITYVSDIQSDPDAYQSLYFERIKYENEILVRGTFDNTFTYKVFRATFAGGSSGVVLTQAFGVWKQYYPTSKVNEYLSYTTYIIKDAPLQFSTSYFVNSQYLDVLVVQNAYLNAVQLTKESYLDPTKYLIDIGTLVVPVKVSLIPKIARASMALYSSVRVWDDAKGLVDKVGDIFSGIKDRFSTAIFGDKTVNYPRQSPTIYYLVYPMFLGYYTDIKSVPINTTSIIGYYYPEIVIDNDMLKSTLLDIYNPYLSLLNYGVSEEDFGLVEEFLYKTQIETRLTSFSELASNVIVVWNNNNDIDYATLTGNSIGSMVGIMEYHYGGDVAKASFNPVLVGWRNAITLNIYEYSQLYYIVSPGTPYVFKEIYRGKRGYYGRGGVYIQSSEEELDSKIINYMSNYAFKLYEYEGKPKDASKKYSYNIVGFDYICANGIIFGDDDNPWCVNNIPDSAKYGMPQNYRLNFVPSEYFVAPYLYIYAPKKINLVGKTIDFTKFVKISGFEIYPIVDCGNQFRYVSGSVDDYTISLDGTRYWEGYIISNMIYPSFVTVSSVYTPYMTISVQPSSYISVKTDTNYYTTFYASPMVRVSTPLFTGIYNNTIRPMYPNRLLFGTYDSYTVIPYYDAFFLTKGIFIGHGWIYQAGDNVAYILNTIQVYGFPHTDRYDVEKNTTLSVWFKVEKSENHPYINNIVSESFETYSQEIRIKKNSDENVVVRLFKGLYSKIAGATERVKDAFGYFGEKLRAVFSDKVATRYTFMPTAVNPTYGSIYGTYTVFVPTYNSIKSPVKYYVPMVLPGESYEIKLSYFGETLSESKFYSLSDDQLTLRLLQVGSYDQ